MQKTILTKAIAVAMVTLGASAAMAESSVTFYGNADVSVDNVHNTAGVRLIPAVSQTQGVSSTVTRVSPSASSQTSFGFKGTEDLGEGLKASFVLEGQLSHDTGALAQDGRIFGRQSYVGLTTPFGEVRLGRQYAPIFYSTAFVTGERFGATDLFIEGGATNNLMVRQDNQISYWLKAGGFTGSMAYTPNAGSYGTVNSQRGAVANSTTGGILGAAGAGTESGTSKTGRAVGFFGNYAFDSSFNATLGFHRNEFGNAAITAVTPVGTVTSTLKLEKYQAYNLGAKYVMPSTGIMFDAAFAQGKYDVSTSSDGLKIQFLVLGASIPVNQWTLSAQVSQIQFKNFTKGKDTGMMLGAEYALSKRTSLFTRVVQIRDDEGQASTGAALVGVGPVVGGPDVIATALGFRETPVFAGAGINAGGKATYIGAGIRHTF